MVGLLEQPNDACTLFRRELVQTKGLLTFNGDESVHRDGRLMGSRYG
ncbi:MAG: hypothetical protein ING59_17225 [Burkholderiales bacterium]|nr:hypothetical protein [Burkholderiales bacterium]